MSERSLPVNCFDAIAHPVEYGKQDVEVMWVERGRLRVAGVWRQMNMCSGSGRLRVPIPPALIRLARGLTFFDVVNRVVVGDEPPDIKTGREDVCRVRVRVQPKAKQPG